MNRNNYRNYRNQVIEHISNWEKLSWREKILRFREFVKSNLIAILEWESNLKKSDFVFLKDKNEDLSSDKLFESIREYFTYQFWIRATAIKFHKRWKLIPSWFSWSEWTEFNENMSSDNRVIHFYSWNEESKNRAIDFWYWVDELLKNTIRSCIEQYSRKHSWNSYWVLSKKWVYQKGDMPILYIFWISDIFNFKDRYKWSFAFHNRNYTFFEWSITQRLLKMRPNAINIDKSFIFNVSYEEYLEIDKKVREQIRLNYNSIKQTAINRKEEHELEADENHRLWLNSTAKLQNAFIWEIPENLKFQTITKKDFSLIKENELSRISESAYITLAIWHYYDEMVYKDFSELIWGKVKSRVDNLNK